MMPASILEETDDEEDSEDSELARLEEEKARESIMTIRKEYRQTGLSGSNLGFIVNLPSPTLDD